MSDPKELDFFGGPKFENWSRGLDWYRGQFAADAPVRGESSPSYSAFPFAPDVPRRIHAVAPEVRLIYMVRDPIERLLSQYVHLVARGTEQRLLTQIFADRPPELTAYVLLSCYWLQLEQYLTWFRSEQVLVVDQDDLRSDRRQTMARILRFVGVDDTIHSPGWERELHRSEEKRRPRSLLGARGGRIGVRLLGRLPRRVAFGVRPILTRPMDRPTLDPALRESLAEVFRPDAARLREHTGQRFEGWSV
jgi:hypothetical protein